MLTVGANCGAYVTDSWFLPVYRYYSVVACLSFRCGQSGTDYNCMQINKKPL